MGRRPGLTTFQIKILYHILHCDSEIETVSHISEGINALHPAVFKATKTLVERGYLVKGSTPSKGRKKEIVLTDKTLAVFILRLQHKELIDYLKRLGSKLAFEQIRSRYRLYDSAFLMSEVKFPHFGYENLLNTIYFMLQNDWFSIENTKTPDKEEIEELFKIMTGGGEYVFYGVAQEWPEVGEVMRIACLIEKFEIDSKRYLKIVLANISLRLSLKEYQNYSQKLLKEWDRKRIMIPELDVNEHNIFVEKLKKISSDVETAKKLLEST